ncbi:uncharacterized protein MAM_07379 [Metarhizium album ARSEF 1941]|uniref:Uncharacterized protein n=1 Tax=Metarhizium album (strain ARSEF 1941) TaxID=1081103 RepID=A0A0B2WLJ0_METAS|nr:uncharacterized protein MAM_07379 [Metarhizium album ARSEF 1941]KHN94783.1 hypothetical protein MAM_07379 [Metarhizium album ARSEF 1941]
MPVANGFIRTVAGGNKFTSTFIIDDTQYHFSGNFNPPVQEFMSNDARLEYESPEQLTTHQGFDGKIGTSDTLLSIQNGPSITGHLNMPISPASRVCGSGTWSQD